MEEEEEEERDLSLYFVSILVVGLRVLPPGRCCGGKDEGLVVEDEGFLAAREEIEDDRGFTIDEGEDCCTVREDD